MTKLEHAGAGTSVVGRRLGALDLLRFVAAAAVVAFHFTAYHHGAFGTATMKVFPGLGRFTAYGSLGVQLFFLISGFVILMSLWGRTPQQFIASRVARLFPAYWCALLLVSALGLLVAPAVLVDNYGPLHLWSAISNLSMFQTGLGAHNVDGVYWTLFVELRFYVLVGLLGVVGLTRGRVIAFAIFWPVLAELVRTSGSVFGNALLGGPTAVYFSAGMLMYLMHREGQSLFLWMLVGFDWSIAAYHAGGDLVAEAARTTDRDLRPVVVVGLVTAIFVAVAVATLTRAARIQWRLLSFLGLLTYPLYLVHENWGWTIISVLHGRIGNGPALLVAVASVLALALAVHLLVERPLAPRLRAAVQRGLAGPEQLVDGGTTGELPVVPHEDTHLIGSGTARPRSHQLGSSGRALQVTAPRGRTRPEHPLRGDGFRTGAGEEQHQVGVAVDAGWR